MTVRPILRMVLVGWLSATTCANAVTIAVDSAADDMNVGANGNCTLREAIQAANTDSPVDGCIAGAGADTVLIPAGTYTLTIPGANEDANATGDLDLVSDVTLAGDSSETTTLQSSDPASAPRVDRVVNAIGGHAVRIRDLSIRNGNPPGDGTTQLSFSGGGVLNDGADLTLERVVVRGNSSLTPVSVIDFHYGDGGGIAQSSGRLALVDSSVDGNFGGGGGGLWVGAGSGSLLRTRVTNNIGTGFGGGIASSAEANLEIESSSVVSNSAVLRPCWWWPNGCGYVSEGGGVASQGSVSIRNSVLAWNHASWSTWYGLDPDNGVEIWANDLRMEWSTVLVDPRTDPISASATISSTIAVFRSSVIAGGCTGSPSSEGWNVADSATCGLTSPSDRANVQLGLGGLTLDSEGSYIVPLLPWSPAIDSSDDASCPATDVLGTARPIDGNGDGVARCDRGAYETEFHQNGGCVLDPEPSAAPASFAGLGITITLVRGRRKGLGWKLHRPIA